MTVLEPGGVGNGEFCHPTRKGVMADLASRIDGSPQLANWVPLEFELIREDEGRRLLPMDAPWYGYSGILIFKPTVLRAIGDFLQEYGEFLPLICKESEVVMYNVTRVVDALDEEACEIERFSDGGIMMIDKHVFREDRIKGVDVFKPRGYTVATYVSQRFVDLWTSHGLTGIEFIPVK